VQHRVGEDAGLHAAVGEGDRSTTFDEVRALLTAIATGDRDAAIQLAAIVRREDRSLLAQARDDEPELAAQLAALLLRH
jgi:hypothetical protein